MTVDVVKDPTQLRKLEELILRVAREKREVHLDIAHEDQSGYAREQCKDEKVTDEAFQMLVAPITAILPNFKADTVSDKIIYWMQGKGDKVEGHLDGAKGTRGLVVVYSVGSAVILAVKNSPGDHGKQNWVRVVIPANSLYILRGHEYMHLVEGLDDATRGVFLLFLQGKKI